MPASGQMKSIFARDCCR